MKGPVREFFRSLCQLLADLELLAKSTGNKDVGNVNHQVKRLIFSLGAFIWLLHQVQNAVEKSSIFMIK